MAVKSKDGWVINGNVYADTMQTESIATNTASATTITATNSIRSPSFINTSDQRLKTNIKEVSAQHTTDLIDCLSVKSFTWKDTSKSQVGLIAQDVVNVLPSIVEEQEDNFLAIDYTKLIPYLILAIQELNLKVTNGIAK